MKRDRYERSTYYTNNEIDAILEIYALRPDFALEQAKEYLEAYVKSRVDEAVKAEKERIISYLNGAITDDSEYANAYLLNKRAWIELEQEESNE